MDGIINFIKDHIVVISIIIGLLAIFLYVIYAVFLNKLNKAMHGKTTWMAWVPIINIYLLGKLTVHMVVGIILALGIFLTFGIYWKADGIETYYSILPKNTQDIYTIIYCGIVVVFYICAHFKLKRLIIEGRAKSEFDSFREENRYPNIPVNNKSNPIPNNINNIPVNNTKSDEDNFYSGYSSNNSNNNTEQPKVSLSSLNNHENNDSQNP